MKILVFMASPNKNGHTSKLCSKFIEGVGSKDNVEIIYPFDLNLKPCIDCKYCYTHEKKCVFNDDMQNIYNKIDEADVLVVSSPMYFCSFPAPMKSIIDRSQIFWSNKYILKNKSNKVDKKIGVLIATAGIEWPDMFYSMECTTKYFFKCVDAELKHIVHFSNTDRLQSSNYSKSIRECYELGKLFEPK